MSAKGVRSGARRAVMYLGIGALVYVVLLAGYSFYHFSATKSQLLTYGLNESTATLLSWAVMFIAIALPLVAAIRIIILRGRVPDYVAVMVLPLISWGIKQTPANFSAVSGEALKYCAERPGGELFCRDYPGTDPITRMPLEPLSAERASIEFRRERNMIPTQITKPFEEIQFFDELSGRPIVWIWKGPDGCFEPFNNEGVHPSRGVPLIPISADHIREMRACLAKRKADDRRAAAEKDAAARAAVEQRQREARLAAETRQADLALARRRQQEAEQARQKSFQTAMAMSPDGWSATSSWRANVAGKQVELRYTERRRQDALELAKRLNALGATLSHTLVEPSNARMHSKLTYAFAQYDAADAIRAASISLTRLELISSDSGSTSIRIDLN